MTQYYGYKLHEKWPNKFIVKKDIDLLNIHIQSSLVISEEKVWDIQGFEISLKHTEVQLRISCIHHRSTVCVEMITIQHKCFNHWFVDCRTSTLWILFLFFKIFQNYQKGFTCISYFFFQVCITSSCWGLLKSSFQLKVCKIVTAKTIAVSWRLVRESLSAGGLLNSVQLHIFWH
jgi:hypothetical protein